MAYYATMKKRNPTHIYCTPETRKKLEHLAAVHSISLSAMVQMMIERTYEAYKRENPQTKTDLL